MNTITKLSALRQAGRAAGALLVAALLLGVAFSVAAAPGAAVLGERVEVSYRNPAGFSEMDRDFGSRGEWLDELSRYVAQRAARSVPDGARLLVTITDVQRAGRLEPWHVNLPPDVRIVRANAPPRIDLSFQLVAANGAVLKEGSRQLRDVAFLNRSGLHRGENLAYEKNLIDDWLRRDVGPLRR